MTLSALTETGQAESNIPVLKQRAYTGHQPVISSALANTPCADLGIDGVLDMFNVSLGTSYTLGYRILHHLSVVQLCSILEPYVARNVDFGTVYACFRPHWCGCNVARIEHDLRTVVEEEEEMQRKVLVHSKIINPDMPPRRVWDLCGARRIRRGSLRGCVVAWSVAAWLSAWSTDDVPLSKVDLSPSNATRVDRFHFFMSLLA